jgi:hypothetical protein
MMNTVKNNPKSFHCSYFVLGYKFGKTEKVEFQNYQMGPLLALME